MAIVSPAATPGRHSTSEPTATSFARRSRSIALLVDTQRRLDEIGDVTPRRSQGDFVDTAVDGYFGEVAPAALHLAKHTLDDAGIDQVIAHRPAYRAGRSVFETYRPVG